MNDSVIIGYKRNKKPPPTQKSDDEDPSEEETSSNDEDEEETPKKRIAKEGDEELFGEDTEVIPLSKFCYAILTGQVDELF